MRAYVAKGVNRVDPLSVWQYTSEHPKPAALPSATTVLVRVAYAGVNPADLQYVNGQYEHAPAHPMPRFPAPMGVEGAGMVVKVGSNVTKFELGDHVLGLHKRMDEGTFAEFATFEEAELALKPAALCWQLAAAMPVAGVTALTALTQHLVLKKFYQDSYKADATGTSSSNQSTWQGEGATPGSAAQPPPAASSAASPHARKPSQHAVTTVPNPVQAVLILGASGGVGSFAVLLAKHFFRIPLVIATCSASNAQYVQQLGADVIIDYRSQDVEQAVLQELQQRQHLAATTAVTAASTPTSKDDLVPPAALPAVDAVRVLGGKNKAKLDLVIDNVGGSQHLAMSRRLLAAKGMYVTSVPLADPNNPSFISVAGFFISLAVTKLVRFLTFNKVPLVVFNAAAPDGDKVQRLADWLAANDSVIHGSDVERCLLRLTMYDLADAGSALLALQSRRVVGKLVLKVAGDGLE